MALLGPSCLTLYIWGVSMVTLTLATPLPQLPQSLPATRVRKPNDIRVAVSGSAKNTLNATIQKNLMDTYEEWLAVMFEEMYGSDWVNTPPADRPIGYCMDNAKLVNQGCQVLIITCFSAPNDHWSCQSAFWKSCRCHTRGRAGILKYIVPNARRCVGTSTAYDELVVELGNPQQLADERVEFQEMEFVLGECRISSIFVAWLCFPILLLMLTIRTIYKLYRRIVLGRQVPGPKDSKPAVASMSIVRQSVDRI